MTKRSKIYYILQFVFLGLLLAIAVPAGFGTPLGSLTYVAIPVLMLVPVYALKTGKSYKQLPAWAQLASILSSTITLLYFGLMLFVFIVFRDFAF